MFNTLPGKLICHLLCAALVLPSVTLGLVVKANAQITSRKQWAVLPFVDKTGGKYGQTATDELATELASQADAFKPAIEVIPSESVTRTLETLTLPVPVTDKTSIARVGQELRASTLVTGDVIKYRVRTVEGGKQAQVIMRVEAIDVASMLAINGAAIQADSPVRAAGTDDAKLIGEAVKTGAQLAVGKILSQTLPAGTVLNTVGQSALINQGTRAGFKTGQQVVIIRNREQVATARVTDVEFDQASLDISRFTKGVAPGDTVQVIFDTPVPNGDFGTDGPGLHKVQHHSNNAALISIALVLALGVFLVMNSSNDSPFGGVLAQATDDPMAVSKAAVYISWRPDLFAKGTQQRYAFQVWRNDLTTSPVLVTDGQTTFGYDRVTELSMPNWYNFNGIIGTNGLNFTAPPSGGTNVIPAGLVPGTPYVYGVELVYALSQNDLPGTVTTGSGSSGTTSSGTTSTGTTSTGTTSTGTTSTGTTTTGTTGTTTGTTTTGTTGTTGTTTTGTTSTNTGTTSGGTGSTSTGAATYYFVSARTYSGQATPLTPALLQSPASNAVLTAAVPFTFTGVGGNGNVIQYVVEFSADSSFAKTSDVYTTPPFQGTGAGVLGTLSIDTTSTVFPASIRTAQLVWWRVGARNTSDSPGPLADGHGNRYVFSPPRAFTRPSNTPPGSASVKRTRG